MSVAFRRDSDEEHLEPRFELPLPAGPNLVTARGLAQIEAKVSQLENDAAADPAGSGNIDARDIGEGEGKRIRDDRLRHLRYWRTRLATAQLMAPAQPGTVAFGSRVAFRLKDKARMIDIVGGDEADPATSRIAFFAPLARAMIGADAGDFVGFGGDEDAIEILSADPIPD